MVIYRLLEDVNKTSLTPLEYTGKYTNNPNSEDVEVDGALPSLYKFCARTATGVFQNTLNTLKTALPGNISDQEQHRHDAMLDKNCDLENWMYVASNTGVSSLKGAIIFLLRVKYYRQMISQVVPRNY